MEEHDVDGTPAGDDSGGADAEKLREIRLMGFLRELDRQEGRMETAALLGINYKTLVRALDEDRVTGRVADALQLLLGAGGDGEVERLRRHVRQLAERVAALEEWGDGPTVAPLAGDDQDDVPDDGGTGNSPAAQTQGQPGGKGATDQSPSPVAPVAGLGGSVPARRRREYPDLVALEPADDDPEVYGDAWPLVREWRQLKATHPSRGRSLSWLVNQERRLALELTLLEKHGLTLPPAKQPARDFARREHTRWRRSALHNTRRAIRRRKLLRWLRRALTLGAWWN